MIIFLKDVLDTRTELKRYQADLEKLLDKLNQLRREIALTETIISMIKREEIVEIKAAAKLE